MNNRFKYLFIFIVLLLLINIINSQGDSSDNNNNKKDKEQSPDDNKLIIQGGGVADIDAKTLRLLKKRFPDLKLHIDGKLVEDTDDEDDEDDDEDDNEIEDNIVVVHVDDLIGGGSGSSNKNKKQHQFDTTQHNGQFAIHNNKPPINKHKFSLFEKNDEFENSMLFGQDINKEKDSKNIISDKELPGRELLIEAQKYRGYLLYDRKTSKTHPFSNSIMMHGFDLSPERDLFEYKGQSKLTPLNSTKAYQLLLDSSNQGNHRAMYLLGVMNEIGENDNNGIMNFTVAEEWYLKASEFGNSDAQRSLGFLYATGKLGYIDEAKAVLYYTFSARSGNIVSQLTMAYRYLYGHGVEKNCKKSSILYSKVASRVASDYELRGFGYQVNSQRFSDDRKKIAGYQDENDIVDFLKYSSDDLNTMGRLYLEGSLMEQDFQQALDYFKRSAANGIASGYSSLGFMYNMGYGVEQNNKTAFDYYLKASEMGNRDAKSNLAELYFYGYGVKQNIQKALDMWIETSEIKPIVNAAADGSTTQAASSHISYHAPSNANLGKIFAYGLNGVPINLNKASDYFSRAIYSGDSTSFYHFASIHLTNNFDDKSCPILVPYMKKIAEQGAWAIILTKAQELYEDDDTDRALLLSEKAAEMGIELAQYNSGWMYDKRLGLSPYYKVVEDQQDDGNQRIEDKIVDIIVDGSSSDGGGGDNSEDDSEYSNSKPISELFNQEFWNQQSFRYYDYSAEQLNPVSRIKIGDYFYYGVGVEKSFESAAESYKVAANVNHPQALFNLGYIYEYGEGVPQDFYLAKRYYDLSLIYQPKGYIPIYISLISLLFHFLYTYICSLFDPTIQINKSTDSHWNEFNNQKSQLDQQSKQSIIDSTNKVHNGGDGGLDGNDIGGLFNFTFDNETVQTIESYSMIFVAIVIGYLFIRRQRIIGNQQQLQRRQNQQQNQQQQRVNNN